MNIALEDLAAKRVKSANGLVVSDHTFDLAKFTGSELIFTGKGSRGLVFKNQRQVQITFQDAIIDNSGTGVTLKFDGISDQVWARAINCFLFGKAGNSASQMIYFVGTWSNVEISGFEIDQRRDTKTGSTTTGACVQAQGVLNPAHNLGILNIHDMVLRNTGDEGNYDNHFERSTGYAQGELLLMNNVKVFNSGRDPFQQWGFRKATYKNCYGENGGLEADSNHCSGFSMNGWTEELTIENCEIKNAAQLIYSGAPESGKKIKATIINTKYTQGTHAGARNNQAAYLKGPGEYYFKDCLIDAPAMKEAAITADGCSVTYENCKIIAPKVYRTFNGGSVKEIIPQPIVNIYPVTAELEETTLSGVLTSSALLYKGKRFPL